MSTIEMDERGNELWLRIKTKEGLMGAINVSSCGPLVKKVLIQGLTEMEACLKNKPRTFSEVSRDIASWREGKGFITPDDINTIEKAEQMLGKLMLVVSEVGEAVEAVRHFDIENFKEEIADTFIRLLDICGTMKIDPYEIIDDKMMINMKRPIRHGTRIRL